MASTSPFLRVVPTSEQPEDYLAADEVVDHRHPAVEAVAARLQRTTGAGRDGSGRDGSGRTEGRIAYARAAFVFVRDEIAHSADAGEYSAAFRASDVLGARNAICFGKAHLLTALLRARSIPAGLCYQRLTDARPDRFVLHGLVATRVVGHWSRLDPRGNRPGVVDTPFDLYRERLAWPVDAALGEVDYPLLHPGPPPELLAGLRAARPGPADGPGPGTYDHLPSALTAVG